VKHLPPASRPLRLRGGAKPLAKRHRAPPPPLVVSAYGCQYFACTCIVQFPPFASSCCIGLSWKPICEYLHVYIFLRIPKYHRSF
jgi:hypothetical protein